MDFIKFKHAVAKKFQEMSKHDLFVTGNQEDMFETYLASFPAGTNPMFRERTEHDCSCCKQFIRKMGNVVAIIDGKRTSIWDTVIDEPAYQAVANEMHKAALSMPITNEFLHYERSAGTDKTFEEITGKVTTWSHFHVDIPQTFVCVKANIDTKLSQSRSNRDLLFRGLDELTIDAVDTVLELIAQGSLYRGAEHKATLLAFRKLQADFKTLTDDRRNAFVWMNIKKTPGSVTRIRNTAIGTLLIDLSAGMELEQAIRKFEKVVAPENYKRPTALVTPTMVAKAKATISDLGLTSALDRRYATIDDIAITDIIFANRDARKAMNTDVFDSIQTKVVTRKMDKVEEVGIERFISEIVPKADSIEVMIENKHQNNLVSLIAPFDPVAPSMFKWDNSFSWSYNGDVADSMRQKVQERGGRVDGVLRFTHMWNHLGRNASLMDLHVFMPGSSAHREGAGDYYPAGRRVGWNQRNDAASGGIQDVDYVDAAPAGYVPVENITFPSLSKMPEGVYTFKIHNWSRRAPTDSGFSAEIEFGGNVYEFEHQAPLGQKAWVTVAKIELKKGQFNILEMMPTTQSTRTYWGLGTQKFHKVNVMMLSPNYWGDRGVGNKHYFFMLDGCVNDGQARGFYNEFLKSELDPHRKVIEIVGSKMKTEASDRQLSGLGFSDTQRAELLVNVKGSFNRTVKVII
jgi:hypothetical protein